MSWICKRCETENLDTVDVCEVCDAQAPVLSDFDYELDLIYNEVTFFWKSEHCEKVYLMLGEKRIDVTNANCYRMNIADLPENSIISYRLMAENETAIRCYVTYYNRIHREWNKMILCGGWKHLKRVIIPYTVTTIGKWFEDCPLLETVIIPDTVTSIVDDAFSRCTSLQHIIIPKSVTSIGNRVFNCCSSLLHVFVPKSVTSIGRAAFFGCSSLEQVVISNSVISIGDSAFSGCSGMTIVFIPNSVTSIGCSSFHGCRCLTSTIIPNSVKIIGNYAFADCSSLQSVSIPDSVKTIGYGAFQNCPPMIIMTSRGNKDRLKELLNNSKCHIIDIIEQ